MQLLWQALFDVLVLTLPIITLGLALGLGHGTDFGDTAGDYGIRDTTVTYCLFVACAYVVNTVIQFTTPLYLLFAIAAGVAAGWDITDCTTASSSL
jgi:hypothetical protein